MAHPDQAGTGAHRKPPTFTFTVAAKMQTKGFGRVCLGVRKALYTMSCIEHSDKNGIERMCKDFQHREFRDKQRCDDNPFKEERSENSAIGDGCKNGARERERSGKGKD